MLCFTIFWAVFAACATFTTIVAQHGKCIDIRLLNFATRWVDDLHNAANVIINPDGPVVTPGESLTLNCSSPVGTGNTTYVWLRNASVELCSPNCTTTNKTNTTGKTQTAQWYNSYHETCSYKSEGCWNDTGLQSTHMQGARDNTATLPHCI